MDKGRVVRGAHSNTLLRVKFEGRGFSEDGSAIRAIGPILKGLGFSPLDRSLPFQSLSILRCTLLISTVASQ